MAVRKLWTVRFRTSPDEYVFTHVVPVELAEETSLTPLTWNTALCGKEVPEHMRADPQSFNMFINVPNQRADCEGCAEVAFREVRRPEPAIPAKKRRSWVA